LEVWLSFSVADEDRVKEPEDWENEAKLSEEVGLEPNAGVVRDEETLW
jgi:hypothetical protein